MWLWLWFMNTTTIAFIDTKLLLWWFFRRADTVYSLWTKFIQFFEHFFFKVIYDDFLWLFSEFQKKNLSRSFLMRLVKKTFCPFFFTFVGITICGIKSSSSAIFAISGQMLFFNYINLLIISPIFYFLFSILNHFIWWKKIISIVHWVIS